MPRTALRSQTFSHVLLLKRAGRGAKSPWAMQLARLIRLAVGLLVRRPRKARKTPIHFNLTCLWAVGLLVLRLQTKVRPLARLFQITMPEGATVLLVRSLPRYQQKHLKSLPNSTKGVERITLTPPAQEFCPQKDHLTSPVNDGTNSLKKKSRWKSTNTRPSCRPPRKTQAKGPQPRGETLEHRVLRLLLLYQ